MGRITFEEKQKILNQVISDGGYYGKNNIWNSIIVFPNDKHIYRHRVETLIVKNKKEVFVKRKPDGTYYLPGGSIEKDIPNIDQALNECREEAHINVKNIVSTGVTYKKIIDTPSWVMEDDFPIKWNAMYTEIYIGEFDSMYKGHVDKEDEDTFIRSGKFIPIKEFFKFSSKEHKDALFFWLKNNDDKEEVVEESYISNYFKNKKLLKKIGNEPEVGKEAINQIIEMLKKRYGELSSKSKIQRERKSKEVKNIFHPVSTLDFKDGNTLTIAICFDDNEITDGIAVNTEEYGDIVIIYPCFFKTSKANQEFTLLHEIGHIRLNHLERHNAHRNLLLQDNSNEHRLNLMRRGKAMYPEVNADLYAILSGANMYSILNSSIKKDYDTQYDYRFTNSELASRYNSVFKQYQKLKPYSEEYTPYDLALVVANELVYEKKSDDILSKEDKDNLYSIIVEFGINKLVKEDENVKSSTNKSELKKATKNAFDRLYSEKYKNNEEDSFKETYQKIILIKNDIKGTILDIMESMREKLLIKEYITESSSENNSYYLYLIESLTAKERKQIPIEKFGIPETRSYPLDTKKHVESAIRLFGRSDEKYREELSKRIFKAMKEFDVPTDMIGKKSTLYKYLKE